MQPSGSGSKIRLLIVEDHAAVRAGIRALLQGLDDIEVVGEAADGQQAIDLANQFAPDFILLDMELPILRGDAVMRHVLQARPDVRVLVLSSYSDPEYIKGMLAEGARGYLLKEEAPSLLLTAIRTIGSQSTGTWLSPKVAEVAGVPTAFDQELSWRELAIMEHLAEGRSVPEIASALELSEIQLGEHLQLLMKKLEATSMDALVELARRMLPPGS